MTRLFYYGTIILAVVGLGVSWLIFPGDDEVAFLQYKDKWYSKALVLYELQIEQGNYSAQVVSPLTDLYLKYGLIDKAVELMETFVKRNPNHVDALKKLGLFYQYAQRQNDYTRTLERVYDIEPDPEVLRKLSAIYNFNGNLDRQMTVLKKLTTQFQGSRQDHIDLAYLYASQQDYEAAVSTLDRFAKRKKESDPVIVELMINLLIDASQPQRAFKLASASIRQGNEGDALRYANRLHSRNQHALAYQLLEPYQSKAEVNPAMLQTLVNLEIAQDKKGSAFNRLARLFDGDQLPVQQLGLFVTFLIERNDLRRMKKLVRSAPLDWVNRDQLWIIAILFEQGNDTASLQAMHSRLNPDMRSEYPVIDIKLTIATRADGAKAAAKTARQGPWLTDEQRLELARLYQTGKLQQEAREILSDVRSLENVERLNPYDISAIYISLDMAEKGLRLFDAQLRREPVNSDKRNVLEVNAIYLALVAGKAERVMYSLQQRRNRDAQQLIDLYYLAESIRNIRIMLETSRQLMSLKSNKEEDRFLGFRIDALLAAKRHREALPLLRRLVRRNYSDWIYVYADVLDKLGLKAEWAALWIGQSKRAGLERAEKRSIAFALLEKGYRSEARTIFIQLAENQGPDDPDVNQLVTLWETDKDSGGLDWLTDRIDQSEQGTQKQWFAMFHPLAITLKQQHRIEATVSRHPHLLDELTSLDIAGGRKEIAYRRLVRRYEEQQLSPALVNSLLSLAVDLKMKTMARKLAQEADMDQFGTTDRIRLFSIILGSFTQEETRKFRNVLGNPFLDRYPLVNLMFQAAENRSLDQQAVSVIAEKSDISPNQRLMLAEFFLQFGLNKASGTIMAGVLNLKDFSENEQSAVANLYLKIGNPEEGLQLFDRQQSLIKDQGDLTVDQLNGIHLLLAGAAGRTAEVTRFLQVNNTPRQLLTDLYYVAVDFNRPVIALAAADKLHRLNPDRQTLSLKTRALLLNKKHRDALPGLKELQRQDPREWEFTYIETLEILGEKQQLKEFWKRKAEAPDTGAKQKEEIAFILIEKGYRDEAEKLFLKLAEKSRADSQAVDQLMYLWGLRPRPRALAWMEKRLQSAPREDKAGWLKRLVAVGQDETALRYIERQRESATLAMIDVMMEIQVERKQKEKFTRIASREIEQENRVPRLKKIAGYGIRIGATKIINAAYEKAYHLNPEDREVNNEYGKTMYYQGNYEKSETLLKKFVDSGGVDHISNYLIAEMLWQKRYFNQAKPYYRKSAELMSLMIVKNRNERILEARIKLRLGKKEEALSIYREQRKQYPKDEALKADYVDLLLELGYTKEAEELLVDI